MSFLRDHANPMQHHVCSGCGRATGAGPCACGRAKSEPFVAIFDVGQGNCNALVGSEGKVEAYFDLGYSTTEARRPAPPTRPCLCDNPLIILSHWDRDHYNLGYHDDRALSSTWLVPEQKHSPIASKFQAKIKKAGGNLVYWPKEPGLARHMLFPWGWVERCTGDPNHANETNSSGLAAFVCVQSSRWAAPVRPGLAGLLQPDHKAPTKPGRRARGVVPLVAPQVTAQGVLLPAAARFIKLAEPVAAMVAASQTSATQANLPLGEVAAAVVRGVIRRLNFGDSAVQIGNALNAANALATMRAVSVPFAQGMYLEIGRAILAAQQRRGRVARARSASTPLTWTAATPVEVRSRIATSALAAPLVGVPAILQGDAPFPKGAKFVLLNGDANYSVVPSMRRNHRPLVVGMTAMHHGAVFEDGEPLAGDDIPFAPGSRVAKAVHRMRMGTSFISTIVAAGMARTTKRWKGMRRELRVAATRCGMAAAAAILCVDRAYPGQAGFGKFSFGAAAAAVAAWRHRDSAVVGLAAALACVLEHTGRETSTSPLETVVDLAHRAVEQERLGAGGITNLEIQSISRGMILRYLIPHVVPMAARAIVRGHVGLVPDEAGVDADDALKEISDNLNVGLPAKKRKGFKRALDLHGPDRLVLNDIVTAAVTSISSSARGKPNRHSVRKTTEQAYASLHSGVVTNLDTLFTDLRAVMQLGYGATPPGIRSFALFAARMAALRAVAYVLGLTQEDLSTVIRAATNPARRRAAHAALGPIAGRVRARRDGGRIAYSYGVDPADGSHEYHSDTAGDLGHPHPLAILKYEAHGWFDRRNTTSRAKHAGAQGDPVVQHGGGHVALGWDSVARRAYPQGRFDAACPTCGKSRRYFG